MESEEGGVYFIPMFMARQVDKEQDMCDQLSDHKEHKRNLISLKFKQQDFLY